MLTRPGRIRELGCRARPGIACVGPSEVHLAGLGEVDAVRRISHNPTRFVPERRRLGDSPARRHRVGEAAALPSARLQPAAIRTVAGDPRAAPRAHVCSMFARLSRYGPVADGITRHTVSRFAVQTGRSQHFPALYDTPEMEDQPTLNLRVRGSSPWRRTHSDLGLCPFLALSCRPFPGHGCSTVARQSGPSRWDRANLLASGAGIGPGGLDLSLECPGLLYPTDVATQRDTSWQADG